MTQDRIDLPYLVILTKKCWDKVMIRYDTPIFSLKLFFHIRGSRSRFTHPRHGARLAPFSALPGETRSSGFRLWSSSWGRTARARRPLLRAHWRDRYSHVAFAASSLSTSKRLQSRMILPFWSLTKAAKRAGHASACRVRRRLAEGRVEVLEIFRYELSVGREFRT